MPTNEKPEDFGLFPLLPEEMESALAGMSATEALGDVYAAILESQCGAQDDSQAVELYNGRLGVTQAFVNTHQRPTGQLQWNNNLAGIYTNPGTVSGVRWCTGTLISDDLFLTAGHCFDQTGGPFQRPRVNGTDNIIPETEIATNIHVNFNYQVDANGTLRTPTVFAVEELIEYRLGGLDFAIVRLADAPGRTFGTGRVAAKDAAEGDTLCIIGHPAGVPKRIEAGPLTSFSGDRVRYNDIDTLGGNSGSAIWHSPSGTIVGVHTNGGCTTAGGGSNSGVRISRVLEESPTLRSIALPALRGSYTIQQKSNSRFVDAHESANNDFNVVTRTAQNNNTQRWVFTPAGQVCTVQQASNGRFVDAHESSSNDFNVVTRPAQNNDTQRWVLRPVPDRLSSYTIQQLRNGRFLDAYVTSDKDFSAVTRTAQNNDTQRWTLNYLSGNSYTIQQEGNARFLDAHVTSAQDFSLVTRTAQNNDTQRWTITPIAGVYTIQQLSNGRSLDAHETQEKDFSLVTRVVQHNDSQLWVVKPLGADAYTIQQLSNARFMDAHEATAQDFSLVTRPKQNNDTQRWIIKRP